MEKWPSFNGHASRGHDCPSLGRSHNNSMSLKGLFGEMFNDLLTAATNKDGTFKIFLYIV